MDNIKKLLELYESFSSEEEYRASEALSSTTLKEINSDPNVLREPAKVIKGIYLDKGSVVDTLLTDTINFNKKILVSKHPLPSSNIQKIVEIVMKEMGKDIKDITEEDATYLFDSVGLKGNWLPATKKEKIKEGGKKYYSVLKKAKGRTIISYDLLQEAYQMVSKVKMHPWTAKYFTGKNILSQYKMKVLYKGVYIKAMIDLLYIDDARKTITPIDIKTGSLHPRGFLINLWKYKYYYQGGLYRQILEEFVKVHKMSDYIVLPFRFIFLSTINFLYPTIWDIKTVDHLKIMKGWYDQGNKYNPYHRGIDEIIRDVLVYKRGIRKDSKKTLLPIDLNETQGVTSIII